MRPAFLPALLLALALPVAAQAGAAITFGIYLWNTEGDAPTLSQYLSIADGKTEIETDGKAGYRTRTHDATEAETKAVEAAIEDRIKALTLHPAPKPKTPYVVVEWNFAEGTTFTEGRAAYALKDLPQSIVALQKTFFGASYQDGGN